MRVRRVAIIACLVAFAPTAAQAGEVTVRVSHADLDLTSPADVAVLEDRLEAALERACRISLAGSALSVDEQCVEAGMIAGTKLIAKRQHRALEEQGGQAPAD